MPFLEEQRKERLDEIMKYVVHNQWTIKTPVVWDRIMSVVKRLYPEKTIVTQRSYATSVLEKLKVAKHE